MSVVGPGEINCFANMTADSSMVAISVEVCGYHVSFHNRLFITLDFVVLCLRCVTLIAIVLRQGDLINYIFFLLGELEKYSYCMLLRRMH